MIRSKRINCERRSFGKAARFPLVDRRGCTVPFNRSQQADRRLSNLVVTEIAPEALHATRQRR